MNKSRDNSYRWEAAAVVSVEQRAQLRLPVKVGGQEQRGDLTMDVGVHTGRSRVVLMIIPGFAKPHIRQMAGDDRRRPRGQNE